MLFWSKFGASQGHEIFIESKCKGCYTIEDFLLSKDVSFFSLWSSQIFQQVLLYMDCNAG